jgi:hypothetical protein
MVTIQRNDQQKLICILQKEVGGVHCRLRGPLVQLYYHEKTESEGGKYLNAKEHP